MKQPIIPKRLSAASLTHSHFIQDEETSELRFDGGQLEVAGVEHVAFRQVRFHGVRLDNSDLYGFRLTDTHSNECSLANMNCQRFSAIRVEFVGCRMLGLNATEGYFQDVAFRGCDLQLARFPVTKFKSAVFEECNLSGANFQSAELSGVRFQKCTLNNAEMSHANLKGTDFRTSMIEGLRVGPKEVVGAVVDHFQAAYMASLLGLVIKDEDEE